MRLVGNVKPLSWVKAHAPEIVRELGNGREPVVITVRGEAKAVLQDIAAFERTQETLALLKILAITHRQVEAGEVRPAADAFRDIRRRVAAEPG